MKPTIKVYAKNPAEVGEHQVFKYNHAALDGRREPDYVQREYTLVTEKWNDPFPNRNTMLVTAELSPEAEELAAKILRDYGPFDVAYNYKNKNGSSVNDLFEITVGGAL